MFEPRKRERETEREIELKNIIFLKIIYIYIYIFLKFFTKNKECKDYDLRLYIILQKLSQKFRIQKKRF